MKRVFFALIISAIASAFAFGQSSTDYKKTELYVGYSNGQVDNGGNSSAGAVASFFDNRETFHGFETAGVYNFTRYVGVKADFSGAYKNEDFGGTFTNPLTGTTTTISGTNKLSVYHALGGVQIKDNSVDKKFKPFAHALAGVSHFRTAVKDFTCAPTANCGSMNFQNQTFSDTNIAGAFGGGLDIRLNDRFDLRAFQADYNPTWTSDGTVQSFRFGFGIVIK